jgi:hypothetical protein
MKKFIIKVVLSVPLYVAFLFCLKQAFPALIDSDNLGYLVAAFFLFDLASFFSEGRWDRK